MTNTFKLFLAYFVITSLFLSGCANPAQPQKSAAISDANTVNMSGEPPEKDCLGLTPEKVQQLCQSGTLTRKIKIIQDGYQCEYEALDPQNPTGPTLGVELKLAYANSLDSMADLKELLQGSNKSIKIGDINKGFYAATPRWAESTRKIWTFDFYRQIGELTAILYGTEIDYAPMDLSQDLGCSFSDMWNILSDISHEDLSKEREDASAQISNEISPPKAATTAEGNNRPDCCTIMIVEIKGEVDVKHKGGDFSPAKKGQILSMDDEIVTGDDSQVGIAFLNCHFGDDTSDYGFSMIQSDSMGKITKDKDGKPSIFFDPGVAHVSVKELQTFETDFQVSTPRLTCSTRG